MSNLCLDVLDQDRRVVFRELAGLPKGGVLGGGTALALLLSHRRSYDFDIFYTRPIARGWLLRIRNLFGKRLQRAITDNEDELTVIVAPDIKLTLLSYPFQPLHRPKPAPPIPIFHMNDLATSKAYTIGRRGAWRDYVDIYFLLRSGLTLEKIIHEANKRFSAVFSEKLFLEQLQYFRDLQDCLVDFVGPQIPPKKIQAYLVAEVERYTRQRVR